MEPAVTVSGAKGEPTPWAVQPRLSVDPRHMWNGLVADRLGMLLASQPDS